MKAPPLLHQGTPSLLLSHLLFLWRLFPLFLWRLFPLFLQRLFLLFLWRMFPLFLQRLFLLFLQKLYLLLLLAVLDPTPTSFPAPTDNLVLEDEYPQGLSCATGGILRGRAAATYYSPADEENTMFNNIRAATLIVKIYTSDLDPLNVNHDNMVPSSKVTVKMNPNLGPILDNISQRYPAIKGIC